MGAFNAPKKGAQGQVPEQAKGNPVYEQTRQDMPLWCCGKNCGRNSRITVFILGLFGIFCSILVCLSPNYFHFVSLRNDTFYEEEKYQPKPFEYAVEANVGLFRYQIMEVFEYPWPIREERELFDAMHNRELERLATFDTEKEQIPRSASSTIFSRLLQNKFPSGFYDDDDGVEDEGDVTEDDEVSIPSNNITVFQNDTIEIELTRAPADSPIDVDIDGIPEVKPGSNGGESLPTSTPTPSPTGGNPNDLIDVEIGVFKPYPAGSELDKLFKNGQSGAMWAPILAAFGLIFASIEFFCCIYKCSWLPTAVFLYAAFMLQLMTMFLFMTEDFCDYTQDCQLGSAGFASVIAVICYLICQMLVCMTPRPPPKYNLLKKPPIRRKKKKKKRSKEFEDDEKESLAGSSDRYADESSYGGSSRHLDPYGDPNDPYDSQYGEGSDYNDGYDNGYNDGSDNGYNNDYGDGSYDQSKSYENDADIADQRGYDNDLQMHDDYDENSEEAPSSTRSRRSVI